MSRPPYIWSYSALSMFENCPRKYWAVKIAKCVSDDNQYNKDGDREHKSLEFYMKGTQPLLPELQSLQPLLDAIKAAPGEQYVEYAMCLKQDLTPTRFKDFDNGWVRGAGDYVKINGTKAKYFDWKSGKPRNDVSDQVELTSLLLFAHFPQVERVDAGVLYYRYGQMKTHSVMRSESPRLWNSFLVRAGEIGSAKRDDNFPANPNPLCGWCPYMACPHNKVEERLARERARAGG